MTATRENSGSQSTPGRRAVGGNESLAKRLISPHGFDGRGPVPQEVIDAARRIARLRVKFVSKPGFLSTDEVSALFDAAAIQAEWMRELFEAVGAGESC